MKRTRINKVFRYRVYVFNLAKVIGIYGLLVCMAILLNHGYRKASDIIVSKLHVTYFHLFTLTDL